MYVLTGIINFAKGKGSGPRRKTAEVKFPRDVSQAFVVMTSFQGGFSPNDDHEFGRLSVELSIDGISGRVVTVEGSLGVRDWSGNWDDYYQGYVGFAVLAHLQ